MLVAPSRRVRDLLREPSRERRLTAVISLFEPLKLAVRFTLAILSQRGSERLGRRSKIPGAQLCA
jgi:hypothetical protein